MKSSLKETSTLEPLGINFFGLSMHFPHKLGKRDGKINWIGRSEHFGTFWATLTKGVFETPAIIRAAQQLYFWTL